MHNHWLFAWNVCSHLVASMSGVASFLMSSWEHSRKRKIESRIFFAVGFFCLIVAFDQAWQDEHRNSTTLIVEKSSLSSEVSFWKEQTYSKDGALHSRDQLLAQNYTALIGEQTTANKAQDSLTDLSQKILNIDKPVSQKFTIGQNGWNATTAAWKHYGQWIVMSNLPVHANVLLTCDQPFTIIDASIVNGGPHYPDAIQQFSPSSWRVQIPSPLITEQTPLIITVAYDSDGKGKCNPLPQ